MIWDMMAWKDEQATHQESLQQAVQVILYRQIAMFLALTLAFSVPLSCDHHGIMNLFDLDSSSAMHAGHNAPGQSASSAFQHTATPGVSMSPKTSANQASGSSASAWQTPRP